MSGKQEFEIFELRKEYVSGQYKGDSYFQGKIRKEACELGTDVEQKKGIRSRVKGHFSSTPKLIIKH